MTIRRRRAWPLLAAGLIMVVGACSEQPVTRSGGEPSAPSSSAVSVKPDADLAKQKAAAGIADCPPSDPAVAPLETDGLPDVELDCLGGGTPVRLAGLRGKPMIINIWAQWCGPCRTEAPFLAEVAGKKQDDLLILGIDYADPRPELAIDFAEAASWTYPQLVDQDHVIKEPMQILGPPITYFVGADGQVRFRHSGPFTSAQQIRDLAKVHLEVQL